MHLIVEIYDDGNGVVTKWSGVKSIWVRTIEESAAGGSYAGAFTSLGSYMTIWDKPRMQLLSSHL
jgi:hypothetical protein